MKQCDYTKDIENGKAAGDALRSIFSKIPEEDNKKANAEIEKFFRELREARN